MPEDNNENVHAAQMFATAVDAFTLISVEFESVVTLHHGEDTVVSLVAEMKLLDDDGETRIVRVGLPGDGLFIFAVNILQAVIQQREQTPSIVAAALAANERGMS